MPAARSYRLAPNFVTSAARPSPRPERPGGGPASPGRSPAPRWERSLPSLPCAPRAGRRAATRPSPPLPTEQPAYADFLRHEQAELALKRSEYDDHRESLTNFHTEAVRQAQNPRRPAS